MLRTTLSDNGAVLLLALLHHTRTTRTVLHGRTAPVPLNRDATQLRSAGASARPIPRVAARARVSVALPGEDSDRRRDVPVPTARPLHRQLPRRSTHRTRGNRRRRLVDLLQLDSACHAG